MAVVGELVEAQVGHQHELVTVCRVQRSQRDVEDAVGVVGAAAVGVPLVGHPEDHQTAETGRPGLAGDLDE